MDDLDGLFNPRRWFPVDRREPAAQYEEFQIGQIRTDADIATWCIKNFPNREKAVKHYTRITRRIGHFPMQLMDEFRLTPIHWWNENRRIPIGTFLFRKGFS